jgi:hypothetical protein
VKTESDTVKVAVITTENKIDVGEDKKDKKDDNDVDITDL